jgi:hypothetical protein
MNEVLRELTAQLPSQVTESEHKGNVLRLAGPNWRLRVSGAWRLVRGSVIESSSGMEEGSGMAAVHSLVGAQVRAIEYQSRLTPLDIALIMSDERVLKFRSLKVPITGSWEAIAVFTSIGRSPVRLNGSRMILKSSVLGRVLESSSFSRGR